MRHKRSIIAAAAIVLVAAAALIPLLRTSQPAEAKADSSPGSRDAIVHLFEWPWASVASECTNVLGPKGFGAVQVSPPQEHVVLPGSGYAWWQDYQPVSYRLVTRRGDRAAFANMVTTCHNAGVKIYVDAVINHMAGGGSTGPGSNGSTFTHYGYPSVPFGTNDFHHCGRHGNDDIQAWQDRWEVQNCELVDLSDLATESGYVRGKLIGYMNDLIGLGVDGFRVDAAKHMPVGDLQAIFGGLTGSPYIFSEVIEGGPGEISPTEYTGVGDVTEFRYGDVVGNAFRDGNLSNLNNLGGSMLLGSGDGVAFVDNHDTQRNGRARLTYKDGNNHDLAQAFMLAWPWGTPQLMSSFSFSNNDQGPPSNGPTTTQVTCGSGWVCEHRVRYVANLVGFRNTTNGTGVTNWWSNGGGQIGFGRGAAGYVAFNRDGNGLTRTFQTSLPAGTYCDVAHGDVSGTTCSGPTYTVNSAGQFTATIAAGSMLALHINARTSGGGGGCTAVATTFSVTAPVSAGETIQVVGDQGALGSWNTASAVAMTLTAGVWKATVNLPTNTAFAYKYIRKTAAGAVTWEFDPNRGHTTPGTCTVAYTETWNGPGGGGGGGGCTTVAVTFAATATTTWGESVYVLGNRAELGNWNAAGGLALDSATYPVWKGTVNLPANTTIEYKYVKKNGGSVVWETGGNRVVSTGSACSVTFNDTWR